MIENGDYLNNIPRKNQIYHMIILPFECGFLEGEI